MQKINVNGYEIEVSIKGLSEIWLLKNKSENKIYVFTSFSEASTAKFRLEKERPDREYELLNIDGLKVFHSADEFCDSHLWKKEVWGVSFQEIL